MGLDIQPKDLARELFIIANFAAEAREAFRNHGETQQALSLSSSELRIVDEMEAVIKHAMLLSTPNASIRVRHIRKGLVFYETDGGRSVMLRAIEDARVVGDGEDQYDECRAEVVEGTSPMASDGVVTLIELVRPVGHYYLHLFVS